MTSEAVSTFLQDGYVQQLFRQPETAFPPVSPKQKAEFETKTAAINVTPTANDKYDIKTIKEDTLWLSKALELSEVACLRIVVIEYQSRPESHLFGPLSTQDVVNLKEAAGVKGMQSTASLASINISNTRDAEAIWATFEQEGSRHQRLLATYLSERRNFMMVVDGVFGFILQEPSSQTDSAKSSLQQGIFKAAFGAEATRADLKSDTLETLIYTYFDVLPKCIEATEVNVHSLLQGATEELELDFLQTPLIEMVHAFSFIFQILDLSETFTSPEIVSAWFKFVSKYSFLDQLQSVSITTCRYRSYYLG